MSKFPGASVIVFDLDDTLYKEIDLLNSAYRTIAKLVSNEVAIDIYTEMIDIYMRGESTFDIVKAKYQCSYSVDDMVEIYRNHLPDIQLIPGALHLLEELHKRNIPIGLITDGRNVTQRNKLLALGIEHFFCKIIISEEFGSSKPSIANYQVFCDDYPGRHYYYIADNYNKDFVAPNQLGWTSIALIDDGRNIHKAPVPIRTENLPTLKVVTLPEVLPIVDSRSV